ncbi:response regulator [Acinetobacter baumannii]
MPFNANDTLHGMGIKTHLAYRVEQAKQLFTQFHYDACLTDLNLPDGSGIDLVKHVSQNYTNTPIAVLTCLRQYGYCNCSIKSRRFDFVSKPVNQVHLDQLLQKALNRQKVEHDAAENALEK